MLIDFLLLVPFWLNILAILYLWWTLHKQVQDLREKYTILSREHEEWIGHIRQEVHSIHSASHQDLERLDTRIIRLEERE